ncbi:hypothetical protein HOLleu_44915 [Holothuria leucospilota]|uniref:Uncharacterized protein n=1 Tax=Holothuria leucospilota TaxID=206669 RepID=A0A9Q0Y9Z6_HOLLE|nr:hypothetical protein HOLleu_44915 [Holothuria leucospilota]
MHCTGFCSIGHIAHLWCLINRILAWGLMVRQARQAFSSKEKLKPKKELKVQANPNKPVNHQLANHLQLKIKE